MILSSRVPDDITVAVEEARHSSGDVHLLDAGERARIDRLVRDEDRHLMAQAHILLRKTASDPGGRQTAEMWRYEPATAERAPSLKSPDGEPGPNISLTHCSGLVAVALSPERALGIDAEPEDRLHTVEDVSQVFLHPEEPRRDLLQRWCLKEALGKAVGRGLFLEPTGIRLDLDGLSVLEMPGPYRVREWRIDWRRLETGHVLALAWAA